MKEINLKEIRSQAAWLRTDVSLREGAPAERANMLKAAESLETMADRIESVWDPKSFQDLISILPGSEMGEDSSGQLVIYTGRSENKDGTLEQFDPS